MSLFLGIDTSAYTTSVALVDFDNNVITDERIMLKVDLGERGLRQAEAHFSHVRNLPLLFERIEPLLRDQEILAVGVSNSPRRAEDSYMPVFLAGLSIARCAAFLKGVPVYTFSHQEGHVEAAVNSSTCNNENFLAVHFSGGTSEVLRVEKDDARYVIDVLSATTDLNAGQLVDRVGVAMGLPFPAGPGLERLADMTAETDLTIPSSIDERGFSFSGAETRALQLLEDNVPRGIVAALVLRCIANTLEKALRDGVDKAGIKQVVMAGGVMANGIIRERLNRRLERSGIDLFWSDVRLSSDNAVGVALLACRTFKIEKRCIGGKK
ncbi:MAG: peptidase M22 [Candidatus Saccharibacteria bacterium]